VIVAVDVDYRDTAVVAACVGFIAWADEHPLLEVVVRSDAPPVPYEPGRFAMRELPHIRSVIALLVPPLDAIIVDGYAWLGTDRPGLGAHLYDALGGTTPVIGIAKTSFAGATAIDVVRGTSARPLYVTAVGTDPRAAADGLRAMHGAHRIPTLLGRVDHLARSG
jgi:deoxyribonuclease V